MTDFDVEDFAQLTATISAAGLDQSKWQNFVDQLRDLTGARVHIAGLDVSAGLDLGIISSGYDPDWLTSYREYYGTMNVWMEGIAEKKPGIVYNVEDLCDRQKLERTEFYNDWIRPQEDITGGGASMLFSEKSRMFVIGGNVRRREIDRLEANWLRLAQLLTPHLRNALEVNRLLCEKSLEVIGLSGDTETNDSAILAVRKNRRLLFANTAAKSLLEKGGIIRLDVLGRLSMDGSSQPPFQKALHFLGMRKEFPPLAFYVSSSTARVRQFCRICMIDAARLDYQPFGSTVSSDEPVFAVNNRPRRY